MSAAISRFDICGPLDNGPWSGSRKAVALMMALAIMLDGMNNQLLGLAMPDIAAEFHVAKSALAQVIAAGTAGMALGGIFGGVIGDRTGRRFAALASILVFGLATAAMAAGQSLQSLMVLRFVAGLGLGGLLPNATALIAEFTPLRARTAMVMAALSCVPVGGILAATLAGAEMATLGWRMLFVITGGATAWLAAALLFLLPESPRYLVQDERLHPKLAVLLRRMSIDAPAGVTFVDGQQKVARANAAVLFRPPYLRDTLALCGAFFFSHVSSYSFLSWLPATLAQLGLSYAKLGLATAVFNFGGIVGALGGAALINRVGSRRPILSFCAAAVAGAVLLTYARAIVEFGPWALSLCLALMAVALGAAQTSLYSLAVHIFPPPVRTTGSGIAGAVGRVGALLSSFTAAMALDAGGPRFFFLSVALVMGCCGVCMALIGRHIPPVEPFEQASRVTGMAGSVKRRPTT